MKIMPFYIELAAVLLVLIIAFYLLMKRRKRKKEMKINVEDKLREEALDKILIGGSKSTSGQMSASVPFDVKYNLDQRKKTERVDRESLTQSFVVVQITERSELSTRKYMFHVTDRITFGSRTTGNDIVISGEHIAERQCEIFRVGKELYVKKLGTDGYVLLKRKKKKMYLESEAIGLRDDDVLIIGGYSYEIKILKSKKRNEG